MKSFVSLYFAIILLLSQACTKDDIEKLSDGELVGLWRISDVHFDGTSITTGNGQEVIASFTGTGYNLALSIEFLDLDNEFISRGSYNIHLITETEGIDEITEWMNPGFIECGTWQKEGNSIIVSKDNGELTNAIIQSISDGSMELAYDFTYEVTKSQSTVTYQVNGIYTFQKQKVFDQE